MHRRSFLLASASTAAIGLLDTRLGGALAGETQLPPLLAPFAGPHGGVVPFDKIAVADFKPAILKAMDIARAEVAAITANAEPATFANTVEAYEDASRAYNRANTIMSIYAQGMSDGAMQAVEEEMAPLTSAFDDEFTQNEALFARVNTVHGASAGAGLNPEQLRLLDVTRRQFVRNGAAVGATQKPRLKEINASLASRFTEFNNNRLADEQKQIVAIDNEADLAGLSDQLKAVAKAAAEKKGLPGKWVITNTRSSVEPFLSYSSRRDLRERVWRMWIERGEQKNWPVISAILALRAERAKILGYATHAHWMVADNMAKTPEAALALAMRVWAPARARVREEVADMQKIADGEKAGHKIAAWDYRYYAEKVRKAKYDFDGEALKPYLQAEKMREAMFFVANRLHGLEFELVSGVPVYHPDVRVWVVRRGGQQVGLWYFDPFARDGKRSGAWMMELRAQEFFGSKATSIVSNSANFVKGAGGAPVVMSWDDARIMFHEFGHALHSMLSNVHYHTLAGTNTPVDFVEFPSQLNEHWLRTREVLDTYAVHVDTGKPIPADLIAKIEQAATFNQGFSTVEFQMSTIYDLRIHLLADGQKVDPAAFEKQLMQEIGAPEEIVMRHRPTQFGHIFGSDDYSAGYYSYLWAEALTADAAQAFTEAGSFYDTATATRFRNTILSVGNSVPQDVAFRNFRGRDVDPDALMRSRGFPIAG